MVQDVTLPEGRIRVAAKNFEFDSDANAWELSGGCAITVTQSKKQQIRFVGDTAKVVAAPEDIEWQISSPDPVDISNIPLLYSPWGSIPRRLRRDNAPLGAKECPRAA